MTEQVLVEPCKDTRPGESDLEKDFDELHRAVARLAEGNSKEPLDPKLLMALGALIRRLQKVWGKKGSFLKVGMSPFIQNLFVQSNSKWASA